MVICQVRKFKLFSRLVVGEEVTVQLLSVL